MSKIKIVHNVTRWLPKTMTWLYTQLSSLQEDTFKNIIVCKQLLDTKQFSKKNFDIYVYKERNQLIRYYNIFKHATGIQTHLSVLERIIIKEKPDILHSHFGTIAYNNYKLAKRYNLKHIVTFYGVDVNMVPQKQKWKKRYRKMFSSIDIVLCEGPFMAKSIEKLGCSKKKIKIQRIGIDLNRFPFHPRKVEKNKKIKFLIASSFVEKKGMPYALEALGKLQKIFNNFSVTIIGDTIDSEKSKNEKSKILKTIKKWNLTSKVSFKGFIDYNEIIELAYQHDIFISPSILSGDGDTEGGAPVSIIEMVASGMPVITTNHCDIPFILSPEYSFMLCNEKDTDCLKEKILYLLNNDFSNLLKQNRLFIEKNLDIINLSNKLSDIYKDIL